MPQYYSRSLLLQYRKFFRSWLAQPVPDRQLLVRNNHAGLQKFLTDRKEEDWRQGGADGNNHDQVRGREP